MDKQYSNYRPLLFTFLLALVAAAAVMYFTGSDAQTTTPKIQLTYFKDAPEFVEAIKTNVNLEMKQQKYFWIGYEPEKENQIGFAHLLKQEIEKQVGQFDVVIVDKELALTEDKKKSFNMTHELPLKEGFAEVANLVSANKEKNILIITAAIYSTNLIKTNPQDKIREITKATPLTFSMGFFPAKAEEERLNLFKCDTEDKTGTSPWGCTVINKSRAIRRRIDLQKLNDNSTLLIGLMDLTGDSNYMILVGK